MSSVCMYLIMSIALPMTISKELKLGYQTDLDWCNLVSVIELLVLRLCEVLTNFQLEVCKLGNINHVTSNRTVAEL